MQMTKDRIFCQDNDLCTKLIGISSELQLDEIHIFTFVRHAGHHIDSKTVRGFPGALVKQVKLRHYGKGNGRNNFTIVCSSGTEIKYGQVELFFTSEQSEAKWALIKAFESADVTLLQDAVTNGSCCHVVPLLENTVNTVAVSLENILGKLFSLT